MSKAEEGDRRCWFCEMPGGAHIETCQYIKRVRSAVYNDDLEIPAFLRRARKATAPVPPEDGVFD